MRWNALVAVLLILSLVGINQSITSACGALQVSQTSGVYHAGDLVVEGNEVYVIENVTFFIGGSIIVRDNAQLIIRKSRVVWEISHFAEYVGWVRDKGKIVVEDSILDRSIPTLVFLRVEDEGASLSLYNSTSYWDLHAGRGEVLFKSSTVGTPIASNGLFFFGQSNPKVTIVDSRVRWIVLKIGGEKPEDVHLLGAHQGKLEKLRLETSEGAVLFIENTYVDGWVIDLWSEPNKKHIILENSEITSIWFFFPPESYIKMKDWEPRYFKYWNFREEAVLTGITYDLTLINTTISTFIKLQVCGRAEFDNLKGIQIASWNGANVSVSNSVITAGVLLRGKNDSVRINDSIILGCDILLMNATHLGSIWGGDGHFLEVHNVTAKETTIEIATNCSKISGDIVFEDIRDFRWSFGEVEREYSVIVKDERGDPLPKTLIDLLDPEGKSSSSAITDQSGKAIFSITFRNENYSRQWMLKATVEGMDISKQVGFLTDTPITLTLRKLASSISLSISRESVRKGEQITISGSVNPPLAGVAITITFERPDGSTFNETVPAGSSGSFNYAFIPQDEGNWRVYASWLGDEKYEGSSSSSFSFTVQAPLKPLPWELYATISAVMVIAIVTVAVVRKRTRRNHSVS